MFALSLDVVVGGIQKSILTFCYYSGFFFRYT